MKRLLVLVCCVGILGGCQNFPGTVTNPHYSVGDFLVDGYYAKKEVMLGYQNYAGTVVKVTPANGTNWGDYSRVIALDLNPQTTGFHDVTISMSVMIDKPSDRRAVVSAYRPPPRRGARTVSVSAEEWNGPPSVGWTVQNGDDVYEQFGGKAAELTPGKWADITFTHTVDVLEVGNAQVYLDGYGYNQGLIDYNLYIRHFKATIQPASKLLFALTFDNGPSYFTHEILDKLEELNVKATFFLVGMNIDGKNPKEARGLSQEEQEELTEDMKDVVRRIHIQGHEAANLSYSHNYMGGGSLNGSDGIDTTMRPRNIPILLGYSVFRYPLTEDIIRAEIQDTQLAIQKAIYGDEYLQHPWASKFFRAPFGADPVHAKNLKKVAGELGLPIIYGNASTDKVQGSPQQIAEGFVAESTPWGINYYINLEQNSSVLDTLEALVPRLRAQGYEFVTLSRMAEIRGKALTPGNAYFSLSPDS